jgi:hypothetical protein
VELQRVIDWMPRPVEVARVDRTTRCPLCPKEFRHCNCPQTRPDHDAAGVGLNPFGDGV